ncbi:MAG: hypothetical protein KF894_11285 [Labilithrix sp.]|nr:hypothetical protein [Labilithrix sp.]
MARGGSLEATRRHAPTRRLALTVALGALALPAGAARAGEAPPERWTYDAPPGCPPHAEVDAKLRARVPADALERDPRRFIITVSRDAGAFVGRLTVSDDESERVVQEESCEAAVEALVVFTAIALDPRSAASPREDDATAEAPAEPPPPVAPSHARERSPAVAPPRARQPATVRFAAGAGIANGPVPGPAPVFLVAGELHQPFTASRGLAMRLGAHASYGDRDTRPGTLDARLVAGHAELTPTVSWRSLSLSGGPALTLGELSARGRGFTEARQTSAFWADVGAVARAAIDVGILRFEAHASGALALTPRTYALERSVGERTLHDTPPVILTFGAALAVELGRL